MMIIEEAMMNILRKVNYDETRHSTEYEFTADKV